jgi:hypothetical protein
VKWIILALAMVVLPCAATNLTLQTATASFNKRTKSITYSYKLQNNDGQPSAPLKVEMWTFASTYAGDPLNGNKLGDDFGFFGSLGAGLLRTASGSITYIEPPAGVWHVAMVVTEGGVPRAWWDFGTRTFSGPPKPPAAPILVVEYYHAEFDHYFVTANLDEITKLDSGVFQGWARTGYVFRALPLESGVAFKPTPVCRFFSTTFAPKSSHFYTADAGECATVKANPNWQFEDTVFEVVPSIKIGNSWCAQATYQPVYRLYNNGQGGAPNHRYAIEESVRTQMIAKGWVPEGVGPGIIGCVPK